MKNKNVSCADIAESLHTTFERDCVLENHAKLVADWADLFGRWNIKLGMVNHQHTVSCPSCKKHNGIIFVVNSVHGFPTYACECGIHNRKDFSFVGLIQLFAGGSRADVLRMIKNIHVERQQRMNAPLKKPTQVGVFKIT